MEFLKNVKKDFFLNNNKYLEDAFRFKNLFDGHKVFLKLTSFDFKSEEMIFSVSKIDRVDEIVDNIVDKAIANLEKDHIKLKKIARKLIKEWENNPNSFIKKKESYNCDSCVYYNKNVLTTNEYHHSIFVSFLNYSSFPKDEHGFTTGRGCATYYKKEV